MALVRWEPARELQSIHDEVSRLFGTFFDTQAGGGLGNSGWATRRWIPAIDLVEMQDHYLLHADLPGVSGKDVKVELDGEVLTVSGERKSEQRTSSDGYARLERATGSFSRSFSLPEGVDPESVKASFEQGVLEVQIPKPEQRKPRRVEISVGGQDSDREQQG